MSQIHDVQSTILAYGLPDSSAEGLYLRALAAEKNILVKDVNVTDFSQKLGSIAGLTGFARDNLKYSGAAPDHSIVWFISVNREDLNWLLQQYSLNKDVASIDLKAVLTEHNVNWTLADHYVELQQEHRMMQAYTFLHHAKRAFEALEPKEYSTESYEMLANALTKAEPVVTALQGGQEVDPAILEALAQNVKNSYQALLPHV
ncbi:MAG: DUF3783 domain-containing protein [Negativicutes bacterium]|nr:DUF3783 domain-containing protein [Negativicutes bacterium]